LIVAASSTLQPETFVLQVDFTSQAGGSLNSYDVVTVNPLEVLDTDIDSSQYSQIVSGQYDTLVIQPIMVGQQANLLAASAYGDSVQNVQWSFDLSGPQYEVGDYGLPQVVPDPSATPFVGEIDTPSPVQPTSNPMSVYWLRENTFHVHVTGTIQGQTWANDVYYPTKAPYNVNALESTSLTGVWINQNYGWPPDECSNATQFVVAMLLGNNCTSDNGIKWTLSTNVYSYGGGYLAVAQTGQTTVGGTLNGKQVSFGSLVRLDKEFPYEGLYVDTAAGLPLGGNDTPVQELTGTNCTKVTRTDTYSDYFMYRPYTTPIRPSIWITLARYDWIWSGSATYSKGTWTLSKSTTPTPTGDFSPAQFPTWPAQPLQDVTYPC
jgi:hypothetical protein